MQEFDYTVKKDAVKKHIKLSLSNAPNYTTKFNLQSIQITMLCGYNTRNKMRWVILRDGGGKVILSQTFLKYGKQCELNFTANQHDLDYYITLSPKDTTKSYTDDFDYLNWAKDFSMYFVGYESSITERLQSNYRKFTVGN